MPSQWISDKTANTASVNPFETAKDFAIDVKNNFVKTQIAEIMKIVGKGADVLAIALDAIASLREFDFTSGIPEYAAPILLDENVNLDFTVSPLSDPMVFGVIDPFDVENTVNTTGLPTISPVSIAPFDPTPLTITIPPPPPPINVGKPGDAPPTPKFIFPDDIIITLPDNPQLINIKIPEAPIITIPDFEPIFPTFQTRNIDPQINWTEPTYTQEILDDVLAQISVFFAGGSGINPSVEGSLMARGRDREDRLVRQHEMQAMDEWANKGYTAPPGMLVKRIDNIREEGLSKKISFNREFTIKIHQDEIENLRFATQQGIAAEQLFIELFLAKVGRLFEVAKLAVEWQIELYKLSVTVFQAELEKVKVQAQVHETQVRVLQMEVEIFKALIDAEKTKVDMNVARIEQYKAEIQAREALVSIYVAQLQAVKTRAEIFATEMQAYKIEVDAYGTEVQAEAIRFQAYDSQIRGEVGKASILESEARAYQAEVQGVEVRVRAEAAALEGAVKVIEAEISNFQATVAGLLGKAQVQLNALQGNVAFHKIDVDRKNLEISAAESADRLEIAAIDSVNRVNADKLKNAIEEYQTKASILLEQIKSQLGSITSAGQLASTIAAGALAAAHVGATVSGSGGLSATGSDGVSFSLSDSTDCSTSKSTSVNYESGDTAPDLTSCN